MQYTGTSTDMMDTGLVTLNGTGHLDFNGKTDTIGAVTIVATGAGAGTTPITNTAGGGNLTVGNVAITPAAGFISVLDAGTGGTLTLGGTLTFTAATTGQAQITGTELALASGLRNVNVALGTGSIYDLEMSSAITGSGSLNFQGGNTGRVQLSGSTANTYSSSTNVAAGTLLLNKSGSANAIGNGGLTINGNGTVRYVGTSTNMIGTGTVNLDLNGTLDFNGKTDTIGNVSTTAGIIGQGNTPLKNTAGGGNLTIGSLTIKPITGGTTSVFDAGIGGTLTLGGTVTFTASSGGGGTAGRAQITGTTLALGGNRIFNIAAGTGSTYDLEISSAITGSTNTLTKSTGTGRLQFSGSTANTYDGLTTVNAGTLILNKTAAVAIAGNLTIGDASGVDIVQLSGTGGNQIANTAILTLNGTTTNAGILRMNAKSETVGGLASTAGAGIVENGTAGASTLTLEVNGTDRSFAGILQNGAAGTLAVTKTGTATQTLSGANTYTDATAVDGGKLLVSGSINGSSTTVNIGGTLGGGGSVKNITLNAGGALAPGNSIGTLNTFSNGNAVWNGETSGAFAQAKFELSTTDNTSDLLALGSGMLDKGTTGSIFKFDFQNSGYFVSGPATVYTLATFGSTDFVFSDFSYTNLGSGLSGTFSMDGGSLQFLLVPEPNVAVTLLGGVAMLLGLRRRRA